MATKNTSKPQAGSPVVVSISEEAKAYIEKWVKAGKPRLSQPEYDEVAGLILSEVKVSVVAGGQGERLWPFSVTSCTKPFIRFGKGDVTIIQNVVQILTDCGIEAKNVLAEITDDYQQKNAVQNLCIPKYGVPETNIIQLGKTHGFYGAGIEGFRRKKFQGNPLTLIAAADFIISEETIPEFKKSLVDAAMKAAIGESVILGYASTKIDKVASCGNAVYDSEGKVTQFIEKPDREIAIKLVEQGNSCVNTGMVMTCLDATTGLSTNNLETEMFMQHLADSLYVNRGFYFWDDLGTWAAIYAVQELWDNLSNNGNVAITGGNTKILARTCCKNVLIASQICGTMTVHGAEDMIIVASMVDGKPTIVITDHTKCYDIKKAKAMIESHGGNLSEPTTMSPLSSDGFATTLVNNWYDTRGAEECNIVFFGVSGVTVKVQAETDPRGQHIYHIGVRCGQSRTARTIAYA